MRILNETPVLVADRPLRRLRFAPLASREHGISIGALMIGMKPGCIRVPVLEITDPGALELYVRDQWALWEHLVPLLQERYRKFRPPASASSSAGAEYWAEHWGLPLMRHAGRVRMAYIDLTQFSSEDLHPVLRFSTADGFLEDGTEVKVSMCDRQGGALLRASAGLYPLLLDTAYSLEPPHPVYQEEYPVPPMLQEATEYDVPRYAIKPVPYSTLLPHWNAEDGKVELRRGILWNRQRDLYYIDPTSLPTELCLPVSEKVPLLVQADPEALILPGNLQWCFEHGVVSEDLVNAINNKMKFELSYMEEVYREYMLKERPSIDDLLYFWKKYWAFVGVAPYGWIHSRSGDVAAE